ncbi:hypothetical protein C8R43DRAFT_952157 [Mycena crocata]|nr:hypothetical protein C8R43DRAFT_952157 [Mycena crocata]
MITEEQGHCLLPWDLSLLVKHITQTRQGGPGRGVTPCRAQHNCNYARVKVTIQACAKESIGQESLHGRQSDSIVGTRYGLAIWQPPECACITIKGATGAEFNYSGPRKLCPMVPFNKYTEEMFYIQISVLAEPEMHQSHYGLIKNTILAATIASLEVICAISIFGANIVLNVLSWACSSALLQVSLPGKPRSSIVTRIWPARNSASSLTLLARRREIMPHAEAIFCDHLGRSRFMIQESAYANILHGFSDYWLLSTIYMWMVFCGASPILISLIKERLDQLSLQLSLL